MLNDEVATYAVSLGLKNFFLAGRKPAEYCAQARPAIPPYRKTDRPVRTELEHERRPRIRAPFRCFGHVVCTNPHVIEGIFWCTDLLRAGYVLAHVPTPNGRRKVVLPWQLTKNILERLGLRSRAVPAPPPAPQPAGDTTGSAEAAFERLSHHQTCDYQPQSNRILMIAANLERGGAQRRMLIATHGLIERNYDVRIITFKTAVSASPTFEDEFRGLGVCRQSLLDFESDPKKTGSSRIANFPGDSAGLPGWFSDRMCQVARAIEFHRPTVIHAWLHKVGLISALAAICLGVPRIVVSFGSMPRTYHQVPVWPLLQPGFAALARNPDVSILNNSAAGTAGVPDDYRAAWWTGFPPAHRILRSYSSTVAGAKVSVRSIRKCLLKRSWTARPSSSRTQMTTEL